MTEKTTTNFTFTSENENVEFEPNNTIDDATPIDLGKGETDWISAEIDPENDVDLYELQLDAEDQLIADIDAEVIGSSLDSILTVFDSDGILVAQSDDDPAPGEDFSLDSYIDLTAEFDDTYYVGVSSYDNFDFDPFVEGSGDGGSSGFYDLHLSIDGVIDGIEPNDTVFDATATGLFGSGTYNISTEIGDNPNLFAEDDVDLFELQLDAGDILLADIDASDIGSSLDPILTVFDSDGILVAQNDDDFGSLDSFIDLTAEFDDTYYVGVSSYANFDYDPLVEGSGIGDSAGFYDLFLTIDGIEPNDTIPEATATGLFGSGTYNISTEIGDNPNLFAEDDVDLFELQLDAGDILLADIDASDIGSSLDPILTVFDSDGILVTQNDDDFGSLDSYIDLTAEFDDTYYVGVSSYANFDYDPLVEGSGIGDSAGFYDLFLTIEDVA